MSYQTQVGWKEVGTGNPSSIPLARSGHSLVANAARSECFLFGGYSGFTCLDDIHVLSLDNEASCGKWQEIDTERNDPARPTPRASHSACACGDEGMFVFGGSGEVFGYSNYNDTYFFSFHTRKWVNLDQCSLKRVGSREGSVPKPEAFYSVPYGRKRFGAFQTGTRPPPGYGRACIYDDETDCVLVFGGTNGALVPQGYWNQVWVFDLCQNMWSLLQMFTGEPPSLRYLSKVVISKSKLLVVGGGIPPFCFASRPIEVFELDLSDLVWSKVQLPNDETVPRARFAHSLSQLSDDCFFMYGGSARDADPDDEMSHVPRYGGNIRAYPDAKMYDDAWLYSVSRKVWSKCSSALLGEEACPGKLDFHATVALRDGKDVVLFGGFNKVARVNRTLRLRLNHFVPSLEELCLQRLKDLDDEYDDGDVVDVADSEETWQLLSSADGME